jgi:hypothetical protein
MRRGASQLGLVAEFSNEDGEEDGREVLGVHAEARAPSREGAPSKGWPPGAGGVMLPARFGAWEVGP